MSSTKMVYNKTGKPFKDKASAFKHQVDGKMLDYSIIKHGGGWALALTEDLFVEVDDKPKTEKMKYKKVIFNPRMDVNDPSQVVLGCNDVKYVVSRGVETILPVSHLEVALNAKHKTYFYDDKKQMQIDNGYVVKYPFQDLGEVSFADFEAFLAEGNKIRNEQVFADK